MIVKINQIEYHLSPFKKSSVKDCYFVLEDLNNPENMMGFMWNFENNMAPMQGAPRFFGEFQCLLDDYYQQNNRFGLDLEKNMQIMYDFLESYYIFK
jgi:hypothetical protein